MMVSWQRETELWHGLVGGLDGEGAAMHLAAKSREGGMEVRLREVTASSQGRVLSLDVRLLSEFKQKHQKRLLSARPDLSK